MTKFILGPDITSDIAGLMRREQWPRAFTVTDAIRMYAQCFYQDGAEHVGHNHYLELQAAGFFTWLAQSGLGLDLEAPGPKDWGCDGKEPTRLVLLALARAAAVGCPIRTVSLDEPLQNLTTCQATLEQMAVATAEEIIALREAYPGQHVDLTFAYHATGVDSIIRFTELVQQYGAPLGKWTSPTGIDIDFDPFSIVDQIHGSARHKDDVASADLRLLQARCRAWGIPLRFIIIAQRGDTPETYRDGALASFRKVRQLLAGDPDAYIFESWKFQPGGLPANLPESEITSHTALLRDIADEVSKGHV